MSHILMYVTCKFSQNCNICFHSALLVSSNFIGKKLLVSNVNLIIVQKENYRYVKKLQNIFWVFQKTKKIEPLFTIEVVNKGGFFKICCLNVSCTLYNYVYLYWLLYIFTGMKFERCLIHNINSKSIILIDIMIFLK